MAEVWFDGHFICWQLYLRRVVLFLSSFLSTEQLQEKGGRVTKMLIWRGPWRSFTLISHSKLYQVGCGFVQPTLEKPQEWRDCNSLGTFSYVPLPSGEDLFLNVSPRPYNLCPPRLFVSFAATGKSLALSSLQLSAIQLPAGICSAQCLLFTRLNEQNSLKVSSEAMRSRFLSWLPSSGPSWVSHHPCTSGSLNRIKYPDATLALLQKVK